MNFEGSGRVPREDFASEPCKAQSGSFDVECNNANNDNIVWCVNHFPFSLRCEVCDRISMSDALLQLRHVVISSMEGECFLWRLLVGPLGGVALRLP